jgi:hypothetical protein
MSFFSELMKVLRGESEEVQRRRQATQGTFGTIESTDGQALADMVGGTADSAAVGLGAKLGMRAPGLSKVIAVPAGAIAGGLASQMIREGIPGQPIGKPPEDFEGKLLSTGIDTALMAIPEVPGVLQAGKGKLKEVAAKRLLGKNAVPGADKLYQDLIARGVQAPATTFARDGSSLRNIANFAAGPEMQEAEQAAEQALVNQFKGELQRRGVNVGADTATTAQKVTKRAQRVRQAIDKTIKDKYGKFNANFRDQTVYPVTLMEEQVVPGTKNSLTGKVSPATKKMVPRQVEIQGPIDVTPVIDDVRKSIDEILSVSAGEGNVTLKMSKEGKKIQRYLDQVLVDEPSGLAIAGIENLKGLRDELMSLAGDNKMSRQVKGEIRKLVGRISQAELDSVNSGQLGWKPGAGKALAEAKAAQQAKLNLYKLPSGEGNKSIANSISQEVNNLKKGLPNQAPEVVLRKSIAKPENAREALRAGARHEDLTEAFLAKEFQAATGTDGTLSAEKFLSSMQDQTKREVFDAVIPPNWKKQDVENFKSLLKSLDPKTVDKGSGFLTYKKGNIALSLLGATIAGAASGNMSPFVGTGTALFAGFTLAQKELPKLLKDPEFIRLGLNLQKNAKAAPPTEIVKILGRAGVVGMGRQVGSDKEVPVKFTPEGEVLPREETPDEVEIL